MKKVVLLATVFLAGITAQAFTIDQKNVTINPGYKHRYDNSQEIRFVEDGVRYFVNTNGDFEFKVIQKFGNYQYGRRPIKHQVNHYKSNNGRVKYAQQRGHKYRHLIRVDEFGRVSRVGNSRILYKRNGKVKSIGNVRLFYRKGRLIQAGDMQIVYNRFGKIRGTYGHVKNRNKKDWHDDWYSINEDDNYPQMNTYFRRKR